MEFIMSAKSHFFSHDFNARNNYKLLELRADYGWEGYGLFWAICEVIAENDKPLPYDRVGAVSVSLGVTKQFLAEFIKQCLELGIFIEREDGVTSESLELRLDHKREVIKKRSEAGKKSAEARKKIAEQDSNISSTSDQHLLNKLNETKRNETKQKGKENPADESAPIKKKSKKKISGEDRLKTFKDSIREVGSDYNDDFLKSFYGYWTEPLQNKNLFRWEAEKTWGLERRLSNFAKISLAKYNESPYKVQIKKNNDVGFLDTDNQLKMLVTYLKDPSAGSDVSGGLAEYKRLTGKDWVDQ